MQSFSFATPAHNSTSTTFTGQEFYNAYKDSEFLRSASNVEAILSKGYQLRQNLKSVAPGQYLKIEGMGLEHNTPLLVKRTGSGVPLEDYEFTYNRLAGLTAAYAFENRHRFPVLHSSEAQSLGLLWEHGNHLKSMLYLSAVSGTEHFYDQFQYFPLVCALRKWQRGKITAEPVIKIAKMKNRYGVTMSKDFMANLATIKLMWRSFPGGHEGDLKKLLASVNPEMRRLFINE